jgi:Bacterial PH domain
MAKQTSPEVEQREPRGINLRPGESVVLVVRPSRFLSFPKYLYTLGLYGFWRKRHVYVLTDQRLLMGRGVVSRTERSLPLRQIDDVVYVRKGAGAYCEVTATVVGRKRSFGVGPLPSKGAKHLAAEIQARI